MSRAEDRRLRALRPPKPAIEAWRALGVEREEERGPEGRLERGLTLFLAGRECPFTCIFCDLWRHTTDDVTPAGAIPAQISRALEEDPAPADLVKLYNASNFFDPKAVPEEDDEEILRLVGGFRRVVVECHAKLVGPRCRRFAAGLERRGSRLEVAMGFETVHPGALERLNKRVTVEDLRRAARGLQDYGCDLRAFVLLGAPFVPAGEELEWLGRSVETALDAGARLVSLIPLRGGEGEMRRLEAEGLWRPPDLDAVARGFEHARAIDPARVRLDTWDLERLAGGDDRELVERLRRRQLEPLEGEAA